MPPPGANNLIAHRAAFACALAAALSIAAGCGDARTAASPAGPDCGDTAPPPATCPGDMLADAAFSAEVARLLQRVADSNARRVADISVWRGDIDDRRRTFAVGYRTLESDAPSRPPDGPTAAPARAYRCISLSFAESRGSWAPQVPGCLPGLGATGGAHFRAGGLRSK